MVNIWLLLMIIIYVYDVVNDGWLIINLVGGWPTPLKNDGVRQLGWWNSQLNGKIKFMFQTTNQIWDLDGIWVGFI